MEVPEDELAQVRHLMLNGFKWIEPQPRASLGGLLSGLKFFSLKRERADGTERRKSVRIQCYYQVVCNQGVRRFEAVVQDVGLTGLCLQSSLRLKRGQTIEVVPTSGGNPVPCQVRWCRGGVAGLSFELRPTELVRSWVSQLLTAVGFNEEAVYQRRTAIRASADLPVALKAADQEMQSGRLLDLGVGGALVQVTAELALGQRRTLVVGPHWNLEVMRLECEVVRVDVPDPGDRFNLGLRFLDPTPAQMRLLGSYVVELMAQRPVVTD
ncbi:MAG: hypothetical protein AMXMBFR33_70770 [Candidatus Xenobia bacterium]